MSMSMSCTTQPHGERLAATVADRIHSLSLLAMGIALILFVTSGKYLSYVTPRSIPYLIIAAVCLVAFAVAAWFGVFHCTMASLPRTLVVLIAPTLLMALPVGSSDQAASTGGTNRAIAVTTLTGSTPPGLDTAHRTITIADDDFGAWYDRIDHDPDQYADYTVIVNGFVSTDSSMGVHQFETSRMLMTCCVLDMTAFGFAVDASGASIPAQNSWVTVRGHVARGRIGSATHGYSGIVLKATSITPDESVPAGYFYRR